MKKILCALCAVALAVTLVGCYATPESEPASSTSMFILVEQATYWEVVYHKDTKVMYAVSGGSYNRGTFTVLLNPDGTPMLWEG